MINILVTIGPGSEDVHSIKAFSEHTKLFRLNGSHGTIDWHRKVIQRIRKVCPQAFILLDIPGIKPRTSNSENIKIKKNQQVIFGDLDLETEHLFVPLTKQLPKAKKNIETFSINDGQYIFDVEEVNERYILGTSRSDFVLLPKKGINLPGSIYDEEAQAGIYEAFIKKVYKLDIDGLGLSFVQTGNLVSRVRKIVPNLVLVSKVENSEGLKNASIVANKSDAVMIDRGDLAAEINLQNLYEAVEKISRETKLHGKPLIMATENLETMIGRRVPSKSEVMSIAHSVSIGMDCIMLSEETAIAKNCTETVSWLSGFLKSIPELNKPLIANSVKSKFPSIWSALSTFSHMPIILMTKSGYAIFEYFSIHPRGEIIVVTSNKKIIKLTKLFAGKVRVIKKNIDIGSPIDIIWDTIADNKKSIFKSSQQVVAVYVSKYVSNARANCITVFDKNDF